MNLLKLIERNVRRNLRRTLLTTLTFALSTFIFTLLISVPASIDRIVAEASTTLRVIVNNKTGPWYGLPARYCQQIREMPGVTGCVALTGWPSYYRDDREEIGAFAEGLEAADVYPDFQLSPAELAQFAGTRRAAQVGSLLMKKHGWRRGQQIRLRGDSGRLELSFLIVGEIPSKRYPNVFVFRRDYLQEAHKAMGWGEGEDAWFLVARVDRVEHIPAVIHEIDGYFHNSDFETRTTTESAAISGSLSAVGDVRAIAYSLGVVVLLTVMLIAANSMAMMVRDRLSEVALMRALGFGHGRVAALLLGESALVGLVGGAIGAGLVWWMFVGGVTLGAVLGGVAGYLAVSARAAWAGLGAALAVSLVSATLPVLGAVRITPALALRKVV